MKTVCFSGRAQLLLKGAIYKYKDALLYSLVPHHNSLTLLSDVSVVSMHAGHLTIHAVFDWVIRSKKWMVLGRPGNEAC